MNIIYNKYSIDKFPLPSLINLELLLLGKRKIIQIVRQRSTHFASINFIWWFDDVLK